MSLETTIARGRAFQASQFLSTCSITRASGSPVFDPNTGEYTQPTLLVYTGACQIRPAERLGSDAQANEQEIRQLAYEARLPVNTAVQKDDTLTITASTYDTGLIGKVFRISDVSWNDLQIARVAMLEEVVD